MDNLRGVDARLRFFFVSLRILRTSGPALELVARERFVVRIRFCSSPSKVFVRSMSDVIRCGFFVLETPSDLHVFDLLLFQGCSVPETIVFVPEAEIALDCFLELNESVRRVTLFVFLRSVFALPPFLLHCFFLNESVRGMTLFAVPRSIFVLPCFSLPCSLDRSSLPTVIFVFE